MKDIGGGEEPPLAVLSRAAHDEATGELIFAFEDLEVHVYLQSGRVAWATSSGARFAFARELISRTGIDKDSFREIVEECRRNRRPLGETLVEWGLAGAEDVRTALRLQIEDALEALSARGGARTLFLERSRAYQDYDATLTFELTQVAPRTNGSASTGAPLREPVECGDEQIRVDRLVERHPDILWAESLQEGSVTAHAPSIEQPTTFTADLASLAFGDDVDLLVMRCGLGTILGFHTEAGDASLWLGLAPDTTLGSVQASLASVLPPPLEPPAAKPTGSSHHVTGACAACASCLEQALDESAEVLTAFVMHGVDGPCCTFRREGFDSTAAFELAHARQPLLTLPSLSAEGSAGEAVGSLGFDYRSMLLGQGRQWHFGSEVPDPSNRRVWLVLHRSASQGLGWALLSALVRGLARAPCPGGEAQA